MADIIQLLPDHVANQIAAGEVVQRPASVVKELLENAIDAKATHITLIVKEAGKTLIQVIDNGIGMSETDARLSFERHATSKIKNAQDLFSLQTKGFRGEALASIAAIAHIALHTRQEQTELGTKLKIEGSKIISQEAIASPSGTSVLVKHLFYNIPARRNFLKSNNVELRHIIDEFHRVALAHPNIAFSVFHNDSELFKVPVSNTRQRIVNIFGGRVNKMLVPITENTEIVKISGFVGKPEYAKKTRGEQFFFVNHRFVKCPYLHHAVVAAFEGLLPERRHPSYYIFLEIDPQKIDINIHPTKTEIKFEDEHTLYAILKSIVKHGLGQFSVAPVLDFNRSPNLDTPYTYKNKGAEVPKIKVDPDFNPFKSADASPTFPKKQEPKWEALYVDVESALGKEETTSKTLTFESEETTASLFEDPETTNTPSFQLQKKYIVSTIRSGMLVINQQRAHQRILYERFLESITVKDTVSQQLLFPIELQLSSVEIQLLKELSEDLEKAGFIIVFNKESIAVSSIPIHIIEAQIQEVLSNILSDFQREITPNDFNQVDALAKSMAKSTAIKSGQSLTTEKQQDMVNDLFACKEPTLSPENKPTFITISIQELNQKFN